MEECSFRGYPYPGPISLAHRCESVAHIMDPVPDVDRAITRLPRLPLLASISDYFRGFGEDNSLAG